jgi:hypothetical protein
MSKETFDEQLSRVDLMASGDAAWDLSENDCSALRAVILELRIISRAFLALNEWVKVEDRLPEIGYHVLLYGTMHTQTVGYLRAKIVGGVETSGRYWHVAHNTEKGCNWPFNGVTHWKPLPNPPSALPAHSESPADSNGAA